MRGAKSSVHFESRLFEMQPHLRPPQRFTSSRVTAAVSRTDRTPRAPVG